MDPSQSIRHAVAQVTQLRKQAAADLSLGAAVAHVKRIQSARFASTYADLMAGKQYGAAARFFTTELYGDADFEARDAQFSRIAGALQRFLPEPAIATAVALARLHASSELLDHAMGRVWLANEAAGESDDAARYVHAWRTVGRRIDRLAQLRVVLEIGSDLDRLTRTPGLRLMLKMMHLPAAAAGLSALQRFLEVGFDTFAAMGKKPPGSKGFLSIVQAREARLIDILFDAPIGDCRSEIARILSAGQPA